eukprot:9437239-Alexandrium_andersonii.AAC.1
MPAEHPEDPCRPKCVKCGAAFPLCEIYKSKCGEQPRQEQEALRRRQYLQIRFRTLARCAQR